MSWIFGIFFKESGSRSETERYLPFNGSKIVKNVTNRISLIMSGPQLTGILKLSEGNYDKAIVAGTGIDTEAFRILSDEMWKTTLPRFSQNRPDGQYAALCWCESEVLLYNDPMGIRKWFVAELDEVILFSTRLDLLTAALPNPEIDFSALGSWWNLIFKLSTQKCFIRDVMQSGMKCTITISSSGAEETHRPWAPEPVTTDQETVMDLLGKYMSIPANSSYNTLLSLSGGMDSRTMLAILLGMRHKTLIYTAGEKYLPDSSMAERIASSLNLPIHFNNFSRFDPRSLYPQLEDTILRFTMFFKPQDALFFRDLLSTGKKQFFLDGAFGEIYRRSLGIQILTAGKKKLLDKNPEVLLKYFKQTRQKLFTDEISEILRRSMFNDIEKLFIDMPDTSTMGLELWLDLLIVRYRLDMDDMGGIDSLIPNIMPFTQHTLLNHLFSLPNDKKSHSIMNRKIIARYTPYLKQFPLIRNNIETPYFTVSNNYLSMVWTKAVQRLRGHYIYKQPAEFIKVIHPYLEEQIFDRETTDCALFNIPKLKHTITNLKSIQPEETNLLFDFLNINTWRRLCNKEIAPRPNWWIQDNSFYE